jgi:hypothetical protein
MTLQEAERFKNYLQNKIATYAEDFNNIDCLFIAPKEEGRLQEFFHSYKSLLNFQKALRPYLQEPLEVYVKLIAFPGLFLFKESAWLKMA